MNLAPGLNTASNAAFLGGFLGRFEAADFLMNPANGELFLTALLASNLSLIGGRANADSFKAALFGLLGLGAGKV